MNRVKTGLIIGILLLTACEYPDTSEKVTASRKTVTLACIDTNGKAVSSLSIYADLGPQYDIAAYHRNGCAQTAPSKTGCENDGEITIEYPDTLDSLAFILKAPGYRTVHLSISKLSSAPVDTVMEVHLIPLLPFNRTAEYCTGFDVSNGEAEFNGLTVHDFNELGPVSSLKFYIQWGETDTQVYFQNTVKYPLHYTFARDVLGIAMTRENFETATYYGLQRRALAGSVMFYDSLKTTTGNSDTEIRAPYTVEFFPGDDITPEQVLIAYRLIEERMLFLPLRGEVHRLHYVPSSSARYSALIAQQRLFAAAGARWMAREKLYGSVTMQLLNTGTAYGTLRRCTGSQLTTLPLSVRDILVLSELPNDLPLVGGTITGELQTPLAHVNVAARNRGTPNMALLNASTHPSIVPYLDKLVKFEVTKEGFSITEAALTDAELFWDGRIPRERIVPESGTSPDSLIPFSELTFADHSIVGVKAANLAELHSLVTGASPDGFAVPFSFYEQFIATARPDSGLCESACDDCIVEGRDATLCRSVKDAMIRKTNESLSISDIIDSLIADSAFRANTLFREASLDALRYFFRHIDVAPSFATKLDTYVRVFFGNNTVRLRSSTNCEDLPRFSGAGLYNSVSAGPEKDEAPSRQIKKVWSSVWNWSAFEERTYWNIDHKAVKMGVAVNRAFPSEAVNGVCISRNIADPSLDGIYLNLQRGDLLVTNPQPGEIPESVSLVMTAGGFVIIRQRFSSLSPDSSLLSDSEFKTLYSTVMPVHEHFSALYNQNPWDAAFEIEFKLDGPDRSLFLKQVRPYYDKNR